MVRHPNQIKPATGEGIDFKKELNADQYQAVTAPNGPALVLAGAGSGKTRTLTYRVAYLLEQGAPPESILLLTFTNKASRQMLERVEELTGIGGSSISWWYLSSCRRPGTAHVWRFTLVYREVLPSSMMVIPTHS